MCSSDLEYITFLDSDDFYLRDKLAIQVNELDRRDDIAVTFCEAWVYRTGRPKRIGVKKGENEDWSLRHFFSGYNRNLNTMCLRRRIWEAGFVFGEADRGRYGEEWRLQLTLAMAGVPMQFHSEPLVVVELRPDSHTSWSRQWIMKTHAVAELEKTAVQLTPLQRQQINCGVIIDAMRVKLVVALLLDGRKNQAKEAIGTIQAPYRARRAGMVWQVLSRFPPPWARALLRYFWLAAQNRTFRWQKVPPRLHSELQEIEAGARELEIQMASRTVR